MGETELPALEMPVSRGCGTPVCSARTWEELDLEDKESPTGRCHNLWQNALKEIVKSRHKEFALLPVIPELG